MSAGDTIEIGGRKVGGGAPAFIIAEVAQTHDGSLGLAHAFIDAAADAGADAIKFQTHVADAESTMDEAFRVKFSRQDATRYDYWRRMEFTAEQWAGLAGHARERGIVFLSSVFSVRALDMLDRIGVPAWKLGSGEIATPDLLAAVVASGKPLLVSTGMSSYAEIAETVGRVRTAGLGLALFQCTSRYPNPLERVGLNVIDELRSRFGGPVGLSDHSGSSYPSILALARGADLIEVHITFHRGMFGPDVPSSLDLAEFRSVVEARNAFARMDASPVDKDAEAAELGGMRRLFGKSVGIVGDLSAGTVLSAEMLTLKKPGDGIAPERMAALVGRKLARDVAANRLLRETDLEPHG
jgi:N,N'-diacetyllegionaminate synthase